MTAEQRHHLAFILAGLLGPVAIAAILILIRNLP